MCMVHWVYSSQFYCVSAYVHIYWQCRHLILSVFGFLPRFSLRGCYMIRSFIFRHTHICVCTIDLIIGQWHLYKPPWSTSGTKDHKLISSARHRTRQTGRKRVCRISQNSTPPKSSLRKVVLIKLLVILTDSDLELSRWLPLWRLSHSAWELDSCYPWPLSFKNTTIWSLSSQNVMKLFYSKLKK